MHVRLYSRYNLVFVWFYIFYLHDADSASCRCMMLVFIRRSLFHRHFKLCALPETGRWEWKEKLAQFLWEVCRPPCSWDAVSWHCRLWLLCFKQTPEVCMLTLTLAPLLTPDTSWKLMPCRAGFLFSSSYPFSKLRMHRNIPEGKACR